MASLFSQATQGRVSSCMAAWPSAPELLRATTRCRRCFKTPCSSRRSSQSPLPPPSQIFSSSLQKMSTSSSRKITAANGFGRGSLTVAEAWALYHARYPVPPDMRLPSNGGWKMAVNGIGVPPPPKPRMDQWWDAVKARRAQLTAQERLDPTWAVDNNDAWWTTYFKAKYDIEMHNTEGLVGGPNSWNKDDRALFWGVPGRTLDNVIRGIRNSAPRLEMPSSPPPSPQWQPRRTTYSSSLHSSSLGPARSTPSSSYRSAPYTVPKREVKEEPATPVNTRRGGSGSGSRRQQWRRGGALLIPKPEVKEEPEEASQAALLAEYERQQRLIASSDDPEDRH
ncbi:uncharacterized protein [Lolium perenne]|uniref:uncharacterized protein n=1 Tax=Lolium perenne TaxID=4522 RepID=UPI003A9935FF